MRHSTRFATTDPASEFDDSSDSTSLRAEGAPRIAPSDEATGEGETSDLVAELEAALMADLHSVSGLYEPQPEPPPGPKSAPAMEAEEDTLDAEALGRLLSSIRSPAARSEPDGTEAPSEPSPPPRPPPGRGPELARAAVRRRERPARRLQSSLLVGAALVSIAAGSAFVTVQSVAGNGPPPAAAAGSEEPAPAAVKTAEALPEPPVRSDPIEAAPEPSAGDRTGSIARLVRLAPDPSPQTLLPAADAAPSAAAEPIAASPEEKVASIDPAPLAPKTPARVTEPVAGPARVNMDVKLRSNPDNGAPVIGLLGAGTTVRIVACKGWCEVVAGEKRGFVFRKFLAGAG